jgi:hypothetical protein
VLLLESALWRDTKAFSAFKPQRGRRHGADYVSPEFLSKAEKDLPHRVGKRFSAAVRSCFLFEEETKDTTEFEQRMFFKKNVVEPLERIG